MAIRPRTLSTTSGGLQPEGVAQLKLRSQTVRNELDLCRGVAAGIIRITSSPGTVNARSLITFQPACCQHQQQRVLPEAVPQLR